MIKKNVTKRLFFHQMTLIHLNCIVIEIILFLSQKTLR